MHSKELTNKPVKMALRTFPDILSNETLQEETNSSLSSDFSKNLSSSQASNFGTIEILWALLFCTMFVCAVLENLLMIYIVVAHRRMRTVTNYFLVNLNIADLLLAIFNGVPNFWYMLLNDWIFGRVLCMVNNFVANFTVASSVFTMTAISIDRWLAIIRPLTPRMTKGSARKCIFAIWLSSGALAMPCLIFSTTLPYTDKPDSGSACIVLWPDNAHSMDSKYDFAYSITLLIVTYVIPMTAMAISYGSISWELWRQTQIGEVTQRQLNSMVSKRKVVRMFIVVVFTFGICWLPYHGYFLYMYHDSSIVFKEWVQHLYLSFYFLAISTSCWNPTIIILMNTRFRGYIKGIILSCLCVCCPKKPEPRAVLTPPLNRPCSRSSRSGTAHEENIQNRNHCTKALLVTANLKAGRGDRNCTTSRCFHPHQPNNPCPSNGPDSMKRSRMDGSNRNKRNHGRSCTCKQSNESPYTGIVVHDIRSANAASSRRLPQTATTYC